MFAQACIVNAQTAGEPYFSSKFKPSNVVIVMHDRRVGKMASANAIASPDYCLKQ